MMIVSIITRRLKPGKTYSDFRKAWYHTVGFGIPSKLYTALDAFDARKITIIGFIDIGTATSKDLLEKVRIDVKERLAHSLDEIIEPEIDRSFGILVAEDDFSAARNLEYEPPSIAGKETNLGEVSQTVQRLSQAITQASFERDQAKNKTSNN